MNSRSPMLVVGINPNHHSYAVQGSEMMEGDVPSGMVRVVFGENNVPQDLRIGSNQFDPKWFPEAMRFPDNSVGRVIAQRTTERLHTLRGQLTNLRSRLSSDGLPLDMRRDMLRLYMALVNGEVQT